MSEETTRAETERFSDIVSIARSGQLALLSEKYPVEFVKYFTQLHSISQMAPSEAPVQPQQPLPARRRLTYDNVLACYHCGCSVVLGEAIRRHQRDGSARAFCGSCVTLYGLGKLSRLH